MGGQRTVDGRSGVSYEGWCRFKDGRELDSQACVWLLEATWVPTVELTVHVLARPPPGTRWLKIRYICNVCVSGLLESEATLYDETDRPVACARQLALIKTSVRPKL